MDFQLQAMIYWMEGGNGGDTMRQIEGLRNFGWGGIMDSSLESWTTLLNFGCGCEVVQYKTSKLRTAKQA